MTKEAVTVYRALAATQPDRYRPDLAAALTNLGSTLSPLSRNDEAAAARGEAEHHR